MDGEWMDGLGSQAIGIAQASLEAAAKYAQVPTTSPQRRIKSTVSGS